MDPGPCMCTRRLAQAYPIGAADLIELQNTVYRVFNQSDIVLPGSLLGNATSLQAATQSGSGGCATRPFQLQLTALLLPSCTGHVLAAWTSAGACIS